MFLWGHICSKDFVKARQNMGLIMLSIINLWGKQIKTINLPMDGLFSINLSGSIGTLILITHLCRDVDSRIALQFSNWPIPHVPIWPICFGVEIDPTAWWNSKSRWNWPPNGQNGWVNNGINTCNHDRCSNRRSPTDEPSAWDWGCPIFPSYRAGYHVGIFATSAAVFHWRQYRKWLGHACHTLLSKHKSWVSSQGLRMCADRGW